MANGLLNLQTDLKSLRYGSDKPYITKDVNDPPSSNQTGMQITKRIDDTSRIAQMLIDRPGLKFIGNQALLHQVDIQGKLEKARDKKKTLGGKIFEQVKGTVLNTAKILGSTLAQVPVNGTGTHFVYAFRTDTYLQPSSPGDTNAFTEFFGAGGVEGAQYALNGAEIPMHINSDIYDENTKKLITTSSLGYNEKENKPIPQGENRIYSSQGTNIIGDNEGQDGWNSWTSLSVTSSLVSRKDTKLLKDSKYDSDSTKDRDKSSRYLAETGRPIPVGPVQEFAQGNPQQFQTTARSGSLNSISNSGSYSKLAVSKDTLQSIGVSALGLGNKYKDGASYTGTTTQNNINNVSTGSRIVVSKNSEVVEKSRTISVSEDEKIVDDKSVNRNVSDFRTGPTSFNYSSPAINKETRINLGNQGKNIGKVNYSNIDRSKIDELNELDISTSRVDGTDKARDLAKFYFEIITPDETTFLHFRAHIDSIDDSYSGDWDSHQYVGRAEEFYTYKGFKRDISVGFKISAQSRAEMKPLYRKMVYLASATAPTYGGGSSAAGSNFMRGTLAKLTIGSYFSQIPGIITSVKYTWQTDYMWEIAMQNPETGIDDDQQELPMTLDCSVSFKPIHNFAPQTGLKHYFTAPQGNLKGGSKAFF